MIAPMRARFDWILAHPTNDNLSTDRARNPDAGTGWWWCDALFMAPAAWLRLAKSTGREEYLDFMIQHWWQTSDYLYDPEEHLYFRDDRFFARREVNGRKVFWSRGNGWVMAGLARVLEDLPKDNPSRPRFVRQFREMAEKIVTLSSPTDSGARACSIRRAIRCERPVGRGSTSTRAAGSQQRVPGTVTVRTGRDERVGRVARQRARRREARARPTDWRDAGALRRGEHGRVRGWSIPPRWK